MALKLSEIDGNGNERQLATAQSVLHMVSFQTDAANSEVMIVGGCVAVHVSGESLPTARNPDWSARKFRLDGGKRIGSMQLNHAVPVMRNLPEMMNEYGRLFLFRYDITKSSSEWLDDAEWIADFQPPTFQLEPANPRDRSALDRLLFHRITIGEADDGKKTPMIPQRWLTCVDPREGSLGCSSVTVTAPFIGPSITRTILAAAHMPAVTIETYHGHDDLSEPDYRWTHFEEPEGKLPSPVFGYAMFVQGAFKAIPIRQLSQWRFTADDFANDELVFDRLVDLIGSYPKFERTLDNVGDHQQNAVIAPRVAGLPIEVLHLHGLASPRTFYTPVPKTEKVEG